MGVTQEDIAKFVGSGRLCVPCPLGHDTFSYKRKAEIPERERNIRIGNLTVCLWTLAMRYAGTGFLVKPAQLMRHASDVILPLLRQVEAEVAYEWEMKLASKISRYKVDVRTKCFAEEIRIMSSFDLSVAVAEVKRDVCWFEIHRYCGQRYKLDSPSCLA